MRAMPRPYPMANEGAHVRYVVTDDRKVCDVKNQDIDFVMMQVRETSSVCEYPSWSM